MSSVVCSLGQIRKTEPRLSHLGQTGRCAVVASNSMVSVASMRGIFVYRVAYAAGPIMLPLFYNLAWEGERLTSELRGLPENLSTISKSADFSEKVSIGSRYLCLIGDHVTKVRNPICKLTAAELNVPN